jgi:acetyl-CoA C-acetyltransferase
MRKVFITGAVRTPIGDLNGVFASVSAVGLGRITARESLRRAGATSDQVGEVIFGNVLQAGQGQNPARQIAMAAGIPKETPAFTVNKVCASGMKAIELGWQTILLGRRSLVLAGGIESMTQAPYLLPALRAGARLGHGSAVDSAVADGLTDVFSHLHMGVTAETVAKQCGIDRKEQDRYALESHRRSVEATRQGIFSEEIVPVEVAGKKQTTTVDIDEHPRPDTSLEKLAKLRPAFHPDGTVTAGNASGINDGAAAVVLIAEDHPAAASAGEAVLLRDAVAVGCLPETMGLGPIAAVRTLLSENSLEIGEIDLWEINEAFAATTIAVQRELAIDPQRLNVHGGAVALGHPIGASGARILVTLMHEMKRRRAKRGVAAMCIGGGMGMAVLVENL